MSGVAGADRVKSRQDYQQFINSYKQLLSKFPGFVSIQPSGSYNSDLNKNDFGDIDLITHIKSTKNKKEVKLELVHFFEKQPDTTIVAFTSDKHAGRRTYNSGEIVTVRYHDHHLGYSAQIDNIIALDHIEASFKQEFLDMPAEKQGLVLGLVKIATVETDPKILFNKLGINTPLNLEPNQEFEFNLSSNELQLRKVTYEPGTFKQVDREILWTSKNFGDLAKLLYQYDLSKGFDELLAQSQATIQNPRSKNRMQGVFGSMITVKSGEVGTAKGANKVAALDKIKNTFAESLFNTLVESSANTIVYAFGRFQPPTKGHQLVINAVTEIAQQHKCGYVIYVSRTQDKKKNPLPINSKMTYLKEMFPGIHFVAASDEARTFIEAAKVLNGKYRNLIMVAGSDRVPAFKETLEKYNGVEYNFDSINVISSGARDPDADDITGVKATDVRQAAVDGDFEAFKNNLPANTSDQTAERLMKELQSLIGAPKKPKQAAERQDMMAGVGLMPNENWDSGGSDEAGKVGRGGASKSYVSYREPQFREGWSDRIVAQRTGRPRTPYSVYIKGKKWKDFENDDHAEAVANKLRAKLKADGRDPSVITIAPTDYEKGLAEVSKATLGRYIKANADDQVQHASSQSFKSGQAGDKYNKADAWDHRTKKREKGMDRAINKLSKEEMLPKSAFAGSDKNKLGPAGQLKGNMKRPARQGDLVGGSESVEEEKQRLDPKCWKGYRKAGTKMKGGKRVNNCVPLGESAENILGRLIKILESK